MAELSRRDFVSRAGVAAAAVVLGGPALAEAAPDLRRWSAVRAQFALDPKRIHLASFLLAAHPRAVREAIERHRRGLDRNAVTYLHTNEGRLTSDARAAAARYLGVPAGEVALTDSTTMGLGLLYTRLELKPGEEVLTTEHDFYATHEALRLSGARVRRVRLYDDPRRASVDEIVTRLRRGISERTRVVALTWVHSSTGVKLPIRAIAESLPERVLVCVDGVHGFGNEAASARELRCDAFVSGCHKWLYGPRGTGVLWANGRVRELMRPTIPSFDDGASYGAWLPGTSPAGIADGARLTPGGFHSFEHRWALAEAFRFHEAIGRTRVRRECVRSRSGSRRLSENRSVRLRTPSPAPCLRGSSASRSPVSIPRSSSSAWRRAASLRASRRTRSAMCDSGPGIVNTPADIDAAVRAIAPL